MDKRITIRWGVDSSAVFKIRSGQVTVKNLSNLLSVADSPIILEGPNTEIEFPDETTGLFSDLTPGSTYQLRIPCTQKPQKRTLAALTTAISSDNNAHAIIFDISAKDKTVEIEGFVCEIYDTASPATFTFTVLSCNNSSASVLRNSQSWTQVLSKTNQPKPNGALYPYYLELPNPIRIPAHEKVGIYLHCTVEFLICSNDRPGLALNHPHFSVSQGQYHHQKGIWENWNPGNSGGGYSFAGTILYTV